MARKVPPQKPVETSAPLSAPPEKSGERSLELPKGAMIAFRKTSGGNNAIEFFLYPDGRISFNVPDFSDKAYAHPSRKLNDAQINQLRHLLDHANFYRAQSAPITADAGVAYEISARVGSKANAIELSEGKILDALKPLVEELKALLPKEK